MKKIKVAVIFGGKSPEYEVSIHSASSALENMPEHFDIELYGITEAGDWYLYQGDIESINNNTWHTGNISKATLSVNQADHGFFVFTDEGIELRKVDVIFPILHGANGEDGTVQAVCELAGIPCCGSDMISSAMSMDKEYTHIVCERADVPMAKWMIVRKTNEIDFEVEYKKASEMVGIPCVLKPANAGSSFGVGKADDMESFKESLIEAFKYDKKVIVEEFIKGFEVGCSVLEGDELILGEVDEIEIVADIFDYFEKYNQITTKIHVPARASQQIKDEVKRLSEIVFTSLGCSGLSRIDFFVRDEVVYLNEINTIPGFTSQSRYPSMLKYVGYDYTKTIETIVNTALNK